MYGNGGRSSDTKCQPLALAKLRFQMTGNVDHAADSLIHAMMIPIKFSDYKVKWLLCCNRLKELKKSVIWWDRPRGGDLRYYSSLLTKYTYQISFDDGPVVLRPFSPATDMAVLRESVDDPKPCTKVLEQSCSSAGEQVGVEVLTV